jgi:hypothetical protein
MRLSELVFHLFLSRTDDHHVAKTETLGRFVEQALQGRRGCSCRKPSPGGDFLNGKALFPKQPRQGFDREKVEVVKYRGSPAIPEETGLEARYVRGGNEEAAARTKDAVYFFKQGGRVVQVLHEMGRENHVKGVGRELVFLKGKAAHIEVPFFPAVFGLGAADFPPGTFPAPFPQLRDKAPGRAADVKKAGLSV